MARKPHPLAGRSVGSATCETALPGQPKCGAQLVLIVARTGQIYSHCSACNDKHFYNQHASEKFLLEREEKKKAVEVTPEPAPEPISEPAPVKEVKSDRQSEDMFA